MTSLCLSVCLICSTGIPKDVRINNLYTDDLKYQMFKLPDWESYIASDREESDFVSALNRFWSWTFSPRSIQAYMPFSVNLDR